MNGHKFPDGQFMPSNDNAVKFIYKEELFKNMSSFFHSLALPMDIFEKKNWESFLPLLIEVLIDQPIILDGKEVKSLCFRPAIGAANLEVVFNKGKVHRFINVF